MKLAVEHFLEIDPSLVKANSGKVRSEPRCYLQEGVVTFLFILSIIIIMFPNQKVTHFHKVTQFFGVIFKQAHNRFAVKRFKEHLFPLEKRCFLSFHVRYIDYIITLALFLYCANLASSYV